MDDDGLKRAQSVLDANGVKVDAKVLREAFVAAETPPDLEIAVSQGMLDVGRVTWTRNAKAPVHLLLPMLYRAMEQQRRDEEGQQNGG